MRGIGRVLDIVGRVVGEKSFFGLGRGSFAVIDLWSVLGYDCVIRIVVQVLKFMFKQVER